MLLTCLPAAAAPPRQRGDLRNALRSQYTPEYLALRERVAAALAGRRPGRFGEFVKGEVNGLRTAQKVMALTFDACGGRHSGYNAKLIEYLRRENIPATLFISGHWADKNPAAFARLARDPLFEIENHGLMHRVPSSDGRTKYGLPATRDIYETIDEMELNARKLAALAGRRPKFYRPAAAYTDDLSVAAARALGIRVVTYSLLSGDSIPGTPAKVIAANLLGQARPGAVVIMHFNHPGWNETAALKAAVPRLRKAGWRFVHLQALPQRFIGSPAAAPGVDFRPPVWDNNSRVGRPR